MRVFLIPPCTVRGQAGSRRALLDISCGFARCHVLCRMGEGPGDGCNDQPRKGRNVVESVVLVPKEAEGG